MIDVINFRNIILVTMANSYIIKINDHQTLTMTVIDCKDHVNEDVYSCQPLKFYICNDDFIMLSSLSLSQLPKIPNDDITIAFLRSTLDRDEQSFYIKVQLETTSNDLTLMDSSQEQQNNSIIIAYLLQSNPRPHVSPFDYDKLVSST